MKAHSACYWLVGSQNLAQPIAVAIDLHAENGDLIRPSGIDESFSYDIGRPENAEAARKLARDKAQEIAKQYSVEPGNVFYDGDSTDCFARC